MIEETRPESLSVTLGSMIELAIECWRLNRWLERSEEARSSPAVRYTIRRLEDFLKQHGLGIADLTGQLYEPGLAAKVIEILEDTDGPEEKTIIEETLSPMIKYHGCVVRHAQIVIRRVNQSHDPDTNNEPNP